MQPPPHAHHTHTSAHVLGNLPVQMVDHKLVKEPLATKIDCPQGAIYSSFHTVAGKSPEAELGRQILVS